MLALTESLVVTVDEHVGAKVFTMDDLVLGVATDGLVIWASDWIKAAEMDYIERREDRPGRAQLYVRRYTIH